MRKIEDPQYISDFVNFDDTNCIIYDEGENRYTISDYCIMVLLST